MPRSLRPHRLIGSIAVLVALGLAAPGMVHAYPTMPDGEPIHVADESGRLPSVPAHSTMPPEGIGEAPAVSGPEPGESEWRGVAAVAAVSIFAALAVLAVAHVLTRNPGRSTTARRIGG